jgi:hypothetical protein
MPVKTNKVNRWDVVLDGTPDLVVNSIDGDEKIIKMRLGTIERILSVEDWLAFANAVTGNVKHVATR